MQVDLRNFVLRKLVPAIVLQFKALFHPNTPVHQYHGYPRNRKMTKTHLINSLENNEQFKKFYFQQKTLIGEWHQNG